MAGIEATTQQIGPINPANLIGLASPVVEPRATAALTDAFRQGVITADDITTRFGEVGKSADAAKVMQAQEAVSPEAQAGRAASLQAGTLGAQQQIQHIQNPSTIAFDQLAPGAGWDSPDNPDGTPNVKEKARLGSILASWSQRRKDAAEELKNIHYVKDATSNRLIPVTLQGAPVDPNRINELNSQASETPNHFRDFWEGKLAAPGQTAGTPAMAPRPDVLFSGEVTPDIRGIVGQKYGASTAMAMSDNDIRQQLDASGNLIQETPAVETRPAATPVLKPEISVAPAQVTGQVVDGGFALGPAPVVESKIKSTAEQDKAKLAMTRFAESNDMLSGLEKRGYDPASLVSSTARLLPEFAMTEEGKLFNAARGAWAQGILRLESGAAIAKQEQKWYETTFFPVTGDTPKVQEVKSNLRHGVEQMVSEIARLGGETPETKALADRLFQQAKAVGESHGLKVKGETSGGTNPNPIITNSLGKFQRDANGVPRKVQ